MNEEKLSMTDETSLSQNKKALQFSTENRSVIKVLKRKSIEMKRRFILKLNSTTTKYINSNKRQQFKIESLTADEKVQRLAYVCTSVVLYLQEHSSIYSPIIER